MKNNLINSGAKKWTLKVWNFLLASGSDDFASLCLISRRERSEKRDAEGLV